MSLRICPPVFCIWCCANAVRKSRECCARVTSLPCCRHVNVSLMLRCCQQRISSMPTLYLTSGLAVVSDMPLTTQFLTLVMLTVWRLPTPIAVCFHLFFSAIEATYFSACAEKVSAVMPALIQHCLLMLWPCMLLPMSQLMLFITISAEASSTAKFC